MTEKEERTDARDERLRNAQITGEFLDSFSGGGVPMRYHNGKLEPWPGWAEAARHRAEERTKGRHV